MFVPDLEICQFIFLLCVFICVSNVLSGTYLIMSACFSVRNVSYSSSSYVQRNYQLFGLPMVIAVPKQCSYSTLYEAVLKKGR